MSGWWRDMRPVDRGMFWCIVVYLAGIVLIVVLATGAFAVDGFANPPYSPNTTPVVHQQHSVCRYPSCNGTSTTPWRWVRKGGGYEQGPYSQLVNELPLVAIVCSYATVVHSPLGYNYYTWTGVFGGGDPNVPFCTYGSPTAFAYRSDFARVASGV